MAHEEVFECGCTTYVGNGIMALGQIRVQPTTCHRNAYEDQEGWVGQPAGTEEVYYSFHWI